MFYQKTDLLFIRNFDGMGLFYRYAFLYPEKLQDLLEMCSYISEDPAPYDSGSKAVMNRKLRKKIWLMENKDGYNPLQLAAKFGQHEIFTFIMNLDVSFKLI